MDRFNWTSYNTNPYYSHDPYSQAPQEDGQHASLPQTGQPSAGEPVSGASWSHSAPGQSYLNFSLPEQILPSSRPDWEYFQHEPLPIAVADIIQNDAPQELPNPQPAVEKQRGRPPKGQSLAKQRFLAGLKAYERGAPLKDCSSSVKFGMYASADGRLHKKGVSLCVGLSQDDKVRVKQALDSRNRIYHEFLASRERLLAGLDKYAQGVQLKDCSATFSFRSYLSDDGHLHKPGKTLYGNLSSEDQERVYQALISRREIYLKRVMDKNSVEERFLASLDNYASGVPLNKCAKNIRIALYVTDCGRLKQDRQGLSLYNKLGPDEKLRVNQALAARRKIVTERFSEDVDQFMATLEPYGNGQDLLDCGNQSGLTKKAIMYLTPEGGLTFKGELLIDNLQPDQQVEVWYAIEKRRQFLNPSEQVPGSPWQLPEMPSSMPEMGGMDPDAMNDPMQTGTMDDSIQTGTMYDSIPMGTMDDPMQTGTMYDSIPMGTMDDP
ncbi:MAG: hypothetical protein P8X89_14025, partial [Reinekea sp.]